ncbi:MAG: hypothetical protein Q9227_002729 [Pyrenula ochraceoflavens]
MAPPLNPLAAVSSVLGIISFVLTFLNLLGIYATALRTIANAPTEIRDSLSNLRVELLYERDALRRKRRHLRRTHASREPAEIGTSSKDDVLRILGDTVEDLWGEFKTLERPFLVRDPRRARQIRRGDYWREEDVEDEKGKTVVDSDRDEEDLKTYYRCDFSHRFLWWRSKANVETLANMVQRVQIRRIERQTMETGRLAERVERLMGRVEGKVGSLDEKLMVVRRVDGGRVREASRVSRRSRYDGD